MNALALTVLDSTIEPGPGELTATLTFTAARFPGDLVVTMVSEATLGDDPAFSYAGPIREYDVTDDGFRVEFRAGFLDPGSYEVVWFADDTPGESAEDPAVEIARETVVIAEGRRKVPVGPA